jgi:uncharacterized protein YlxW (UPF0749 family)
MERGLGRRGAAWRGPGRPVPAALGAVAVFAAAGVIFAASAATARGTQLRADRTDLAALIRSESAKRDDREQHLTALRREGDALTASAAGSDSQVADLRRQVNAVAGSAGLTDVTGRGLEITLNDAPTGGARSPGVEPDFLVVHQQDVQAVVNALWAGGAEAMMLMDQRVISTSAVRCVGNTLILQGRLYAPPYRIAAIGNVPELKKAIAASPTIPIYWQYRDAYGLGWAEEERDLSMPAFRGSLALHHASVPRATPSPSAAGTPPPGVSAGSTAGPTSSATGVTP